MMRVHWFSPCSPERTDIGHYTLRVCEALSRRCDLTLWTHPQHFQGANPPPWRQQYQAYPYHDLPARLPLLNRADAVFYNIGNNAKYHREILAAMRSVPGVAIMHDRSLFECMSSAYRERPDGERLFLDLTDATYGPIARAEIRSWLDQKSPIDQLAVRYPFSTHASLGAWGSIHHTPATETDEPQPTGWPDWTLPLPYPASPILDLPKLRERDQRLHLLVFGYIGGPNRRLGPVLEAIAAHPQRHRIHLHLAGEIHPDLQIERKIQSLKLGPQVSLLGFLPEAALDALLRQCDLVINLRYPTRGEASGSLLRAWNQAAPSAVTDAGTYAQLPESVVWKIDPQREAQDLQTLWTHLLANPAEAAEKGRQGRLRLESLHGVDSYVEALLQIASTPAELRGPGIRPFLEQRYALFAQRLFQLEPEAAAPVVASLDRELQSWFG